MSLSSAQRSRFRVFFGDGASDGGALCLRFLLLDEASSRALQAGDDGDCFGRDMLWVHPGC